MKIHPSAQVHPTAVVSDEAEIGENCIIGPYSVIQGKVKIGDNNIIEGHVSFGSRDGLVVVGKNNHFYPGAAVGGPPQDISFKNDETSLVIGDSNTIREFTTLNVGTKKGKGTTRVGSNCFLMAYVHVGHDCQLGDNVIIANNGQLAGHVTIEDHVTISALCGFVQGTRVGKYAFVGGGTEANKDILPFSRAQGRWAVVRATNKIGLQRKGFAQEDIDAIHKAIRIVIMGSATMNEAFERIQTEVPPGPHIEYLVKFIKESVRGIAK
ncbi:MAG: acyl-ACP--UDP-N-acetylglucosamine O-acyltransferase [Pseudobdellovibrionaceae bacterium]